MFSKSIFTASFRLDNVFLDKTSTSKLSVKKIGLQNTGSASLVHNAKVEIALNKSVLSEVQLSVNARPYNLLWSLFKQNKT